MYSFKHEEFHEPDFSLQRWGVKNNKNDDAFLQHHGIKGQRWGVRRYQNADGSLTAAGRERYGRPMKLEAAQKELNKDRSHLQRALIAKNAGSVALGLGTTAATLNPFLGLKVATDAMWLAGQTQYERFKDLVTKYNPVKLSEIEIDVGTKFNRTSMKEKETDKRRMYVGYEKDKIGKEYYAKTWPDTLRKIAGKPDAKVYANTYEVNTKILAPSFEKRKEAANAVINASKNMKAELGKAYALDQLRLKTGMLGAKSLKEIYAGASDKESAESAKKFVKQWTDKIDKMTFDANNSDNFAMFRASIPTNDKLMDAYIKELKKQGYNAVFDDNANTDSSFIVFDPSMLTQTGSKEIVSGKKRK